MEPPAGSMGSFTPSVYHGWNCDLWINGVFCEPKPDVAWSLEFSYETRFPGPASATNWYDDKLIAHLTLRKATGEETTIPVKPSIEVTTMPNRVAIYLELDGPERRKARALMPPDVPGDQNEL